MDCKLQTEIILLTRLQKIVSPIWIYYKFNWHLVSWPGKRLFLKIKLEGKGDGCSGDKIL